MIHAQDIVAQVESLPPLPSTAVRLVEVLNDPKSTIDEIVETIRYDEAVTSEVLRLCNSAYFGLSRNVTSLTDAMLCLGTVKVLQMVMAIHTNSMLKHEQAGYGLEPGVLWKHAVAVALASSGLAQRIKSPNVSLAFTAGLLHDVGKVVLNTFVADEFAEIVRRVTEDHVAFVDAEQQVLGVSHAEIGALVAEKWNLPEGLVRCIRFHHDPDQLDPPDPLVDTVYLGNCIGLLLGIGLGDDGLCSRADPAVVERHGLVEHDLEANGAQMIVDLKRVQAIFGETDSNPSASTLGANEGGQKCLTTF